MKNISHSPVTEMLSGKNKIWLTVGLALMSAADLCACIALWVFGAASSYWFLPFVMAVIDLLYLAGVALSNQRFKYARTLFIAYIVITIVFVIIWLAEFASYPVMFTDMALSAWGILHVVGILAVAISYLYASRRLRLMRHVQFALAIAFSAVALLACVLFYGVTVISDGYFGQGHGTLPLVYNYIGDDECEVADIVYGRGDRVVIPYEFNGRKVTSVSAKVFTYADIKSVTLNCDSSVELCKDISSSLNTSITIYTDKKAVDTIKQKLYGRNSIDRYYVYQFALGNNVRPIVDKDEVYVTFDYDRDSYSTAQMEIIPTWYGKKGDTFMLSDIESVEHAQHSDIDSDDDLYYGYTNGGYIMSELQDGGAALDGMAIDKSRNNVQVRFQKVYMIFAGEGNDSMYKTAEHMEFSTVKGVTQDYKLTVEQNADKILEQFNRGEGFTRTMKYKQGSGSYQTFLSLSAILREGKDEVTIAPNWTLVQPKLTPSSLTAAEDIIYGDDYELTATVTHPLGDVEVSYEWYDEGLRVGYAQVLKREAKSVGEAKFTAIVTVSAPQVTSLTTGNAAEITVNVNKRPLTVTWEHKSGDLMGEEAQFYDKESVFDGKQRYIQPKAQNLVYNDYILFMGYTAMSAGTHTEKATLSSSIAEKYYIAEGETYTYTIYPCPVALTWDNDTEFEYDGTPHTPTAHALDLSGEELTIWYTGTQTNAGENYTATAILVNSDYTIDDASEKSMGYKITPKQVSVTWGNTALTYKGDSQAPAATAVGVNNDNVNLNITGGQIDVNMIDGNKTATYTATAASADKNYTLDPTTTSMEFTIVPYVLTNIKWANSVVTYNGKPQAPTATVVGVKNQSVPLTVIIEDFPSGAIDAGQYTATATVADTNYTIYDGPLFPTYDDVQSTLTAAQWPFIILPMEVSVEWSNTSLTYNGAEQKPTATAKDINGEDLPLTVTGGVKIGNGTATAAFSSEQRNYTLTNTTQAFTIARKTLNVTVHDVTVEYGHVPSFDITVDGIIDGDDVTVVPALGGYIPDENGTRPEGEYDITAGLSGSAANCYTINLVRKGTLTVTAPTQPAED